MAYRAERYSALSLEDREAVARVMEELAICPLDRDSARSGMLVERMRAAGLRVVIVDYMHDQRVRLRGAVSYYAVEAFVSQEDKAALERIIEGLVPFPLRAFVREHLHRAHDEHG